jgi:hypothetical protein
METALDQRTTKAAPATTTCRGRRRSTLGTRLREGERPWRGRVDAKPHQEHVGAVSEVGGWTEQPESSPERGGRGWESANLPLIGRTPARFLGRAGPGRRDGASGGLGRAWGGQLRRRHGQLGAVVAFLGCFSHALCVSFGRGENKWRRKEGKMEEVRVC